MNTLLRDEELQEAFETVSFAYQRGIHAVIVQDIGLLSRIRKAFPDLPIHASTQMNLFGAEAFSHAKKSGISRIILPRELSIEQIQKRAEAGEREGVETEVFIHGALCVSCSGLCLFSAMNGSGDRSGNRGHCAQPCREEYALVGRNQTILRMGRIFSIKDQSALPWLAKLIRAKIHSLKIEGRMKDSDYVHTVVRFYREQIDRLSAGAGALAEITDKMTDALMLSFNRGGAFTSGHMSGLRSTLSAGNFSGKFGILIGDIIRITPQGGLLEISVKKYLPLKPKDVVSIRENNREEASFPIGRVNFSHDHCTLQGLHPEALSKLKPGMSVYLTKVNNMADFFDDPDTPSRTPVMIRIEKDPENPNIIQVSARIDHLFGKAYVAEHAFKLPADYSGPVLEKQRFEDQLARCTDTPFKLNRVEMSPDSMLRVPVSFVNSIRRDILNDLETKIQTGRRQRDGPISDDPLEEEPQSLLPETISQPSSFPVALEYLSLRLNPDNIFRDSPYYIFSVYDIADAENVRRIEALIHDNTEAVIYIRIPGAYSDLQSEWMEGKIRSFCKRVGPVFQGVLTSDRFYSGAPVVLSHQANIFNSDALVEALKTRPTAFSLSEELPDMEVIRILSDERLRGQPAKLIISRYGPVEWMQSMFCPLGQNREGCNMCKNHPVAFLHSTSNPKNSGNQSSLFSLFHPEFCTSELFGPRINIRSEKTIRLLKVMNIDMIHLVRVLSESTEQIRDIVSSIRDDSHTRERAEE
jgi:putative protease